MAHVSLQILTRETLNKFDGSELLVFRVCLCAYRIHPIIDMTISCEFLARVSSFLDLFVLLVLIEMIKLIDIIVLIVFIVFFLCIILIVLIDMIAVILFIN